MGTETIVMALIEGALIIWAARGIAKDIISIYKTYKNEGTGDF